MSVQNSPIHAFCEPEIVRVYNELLHEILSTAAVSGFRSRSALGFASSEVLRLCARHAIMKCAAKANPTKSQKSERIFRMAATETPSLNVRPRECRTAVVVPSSTPSPKGTKEATSWAHRFADSTR